MAGTHVESEQVTGRQVTRQGKKSPAVRLQLSVTENEVHHQQEIVRKVTKAHEVVEVDGFFFKRKRRTPLGESDNAQASAKKFRQPLKAQETDQEAGEVSQQQQETAVQDEHVPDAATSQPPLADTHGQQGAHEMLGQPQKQRPPALDLLEAAQAALTSLPSDCGSEAERLVALCEKLVQDEMRSAEGHPGAELLQKMLERFLADVRASLGNGSLQCRDRLLQEAAAAESQNRLRAQLEAQKAVLSARLDRFQQEEAEWNALLESSRAMAEEAAAAVPAHADPADGPAMVQPDAAIAEGVLHSDAAAAAQGNDASEGGVERRPGLLQQAQMVAHRGLTLQVEGLTAMVEGVQELVAAADQITSAEFDKLYKEKFSALPGLNSPARLIREITRPPHSRLQAAAPADGQPASPSTPAS